MLNLRAFADTAVVLTRKAAFAAWLAGLALAGGTVLSQPAQAVEMVSRGGYVLQVEVHRGKLLRLDRAAAAVFISDPEIADVQVKSPRLVYLFAKKPGETTLFAVDGKERVLANVDIHVSHNLAKLEAGIKKLFPRAQLTISSMDETVVIDGRVTSASAAEEIRRIAVDYAGAPDKVIVRLGVDAPNQVNLRVRVAEVARDVDKQLGFNWSLLGTAAGISIGLATSNPFAANVAQNTLNLGKKIGSFDLNAIVDALENEGLISILAEPNLTAMSGETASFLAGGEFPILVPDSDGRVTIEFKKFGISLAFTPTLVGDGRINLHVRPEVSQLSNTNAVTLNGFEVPSLTTRRADTTVELGSGQSFAIAGLIQNNVTHSISKFPGLGDVPVLGPLFRSDRFQREETELVILVTPYTVKPVSTRRLAAPTDGFTAPDDKERIVGGGNSRRKEKAGNPVTVDPQGKSLIGPVGFTLGD